MRITLHIKRFFRMLHKCDFGPRISQRLDIGQNCTRCLPVLIVFFYVKMNWILFPVWLFHLLHVVVKSVLVISLFSFFLILPESLMSIFWKEWRSTENKYSLIEYVFPLSHCSAFMLTCALIPTQSLHCFFFFFTSQSLRINPRLLQYNRYHLTYMGRGIFFLSP